MVTKDDEDVVCVDPQYLPNKFLEFMLGTPASVVAQADNEVVVLFGNFEVMIVGIRYYKDLRLAEFLRY